MILAGRAGAHGADAHAVTRRAAHDSGDEALQRAGGALVG
eukprot:CAMPEP_0119434350 /NCGR_PEP_ID=MMETSP1335-20130426/50625_1 /TAXON_ID=259385 /ORGANISM="Chrysoculter rhomboideus, Strain RCC1486" /LENGTH=39 /DNA_ID= /DNA_START= /DNA_END= /DNA_ORIENTATION=